MGALKNNRTTTDGHKSEGPPPGGRAVQLTPPVLPGPARGIPARGVRALELTLRLSPAQLGDIAAVVAELLDEHVAARVEAALVSTRSDDGERLLSVTEVAERVGVSRRTVYRALSGGTLVGELV